VIFGHVPQFETGVIENEATVPVFVQRLDKQLLFELVRAMEMISEHAV
jgi:hypothetical protein